MSVARFSRLALVLAPMLMLSGCASTSLVKQLGGIDTIKSLSSGFLNNVAGDGRVSSLLAGKDMSALSGKLSDQICSMTGGDCKSLLSSSQITEAAKKFSPDTTKALGDNFSKALDGVTSSKAVKDAMNKTVGSKIGGILGGLL